MNSLLSLVHGGGYTRGSTIPFSSSMLASRVNAVVVTIDYRLNIFGNQIDMLEY